MVIDHVNGIVNSMGQLPLSRLLRELDHVSNELCRLIDSAECVHRLHPQESMRSAALQVSQQVSTVMYKLNQNKVLYNQIKAASAVSCAFLDESELAILNSILKDFDLLARSNFDEKLLKLQVKVDRAAAQFEFEATKPRSKAASVSAVQSLESFIQCRFELSNALGFPTASHMILLGKSFQTSDQVQLWLRDEAKRVCIHELQSHLNEKAILSDDIIPHIAFILTLFDLKFTAQWKNDILQVKLTEDHKPLGNIFLDLSPRPGKSAVPTQHTLQARIPPNQVGCVVISLSIADLKRISIMEMRNLYHEMGHALHSLLSEVPFQIVSGTRCVEDLVEVPSTCFERIFEERNDVAPLYKSTEHVSQLQVAYIDQLLHSRPPGKAFGWSLPLLEETHDAICANTFSFAPESFWHARVVALARYGGYCYAYPLSTRLSRQIDMKRLRELLKRGGLLSILDFDFSSKMN